MDWFFDWIKIWRVTGCQGQLKIVQKWQFENVQLWQFNEKNRKAIIRAHAEEGLIPNTAKTFDNVDDAMKELFGE